MSDPASIYCQQLLHRDVNTFSCRSLNLCRPLREVAIDLDLAIPCFNVIAPK